MALLDDFKMQYRIGGVVQKLLFWNIGVSVVFFILNAFVPSFHHLLLGWIGLSSKTTIALARPWSFFTYAFLHANVFHLIFNMIVLNFVGRLFMTYFTQKQFLAVYCLGAVFGGIFYVLSSFVFSTGIILVGASAAIMAALVALATYAPYMPVRLLLIGEVKMWHIALALLIMDLIQIPVSNTGGHIAHLGGAFFGFLFIKALQSGTDISKPFTFVVDKAANLFNPKPAKHPFKKVHVNPNKTQHTTQSSQGGLIGVGTAGVVKDPEQQRIDHILDKISKSGYDSLSKEEKDFLFKIGK
ncbi:rhomboid family intramembrane serine protease [Flavobacterium sp. HSC-61S13]|uniref:rhomboid family intramembrane serine protease n=1 Tax=Flavobacterium sp. HSC-61S13 TaxID=2910963 RepID=UPI0020A15DE3|nr:rhomboid family intramembrane serine protease [Flavobacterium sp. HSC-61S13]MCP1995679.1 membrane associated rhomboid family serine protease [Flavobacterium sp. HSC-61S13]